MTLSDDEKFRLFQIVVGALLTACTTLAIGLLVVGALAAVGVIR